MQKLLQPQWVVVLFVLIRAGDIAIQAAAGRDSLRAIAYGFVAVLALLVVVLTVFGL